MCPDVFRGPWGGSHCRDSPVQTIRKCSCAPGSRGRGGRCEVHGGRSGGVRKLEKGWTLPKWTGLKKMEKGRAKGNNTRKPTPPTPVESTLLMPSAAGLSGCEEEHLTLSAQLNDHRWVLNEKSSVSSFSNSSAINFERKQDGWNCLPVPNGGRGGRILLANSKRQSRSSPRDPGCQPKWEHLSKLKATPKGCWHLLQKF